MEGGDYRMSTIDNRIVQMAFDNAQFSQGVAATMTELSKLNQSLQLQGATKGFENLDAAANEVSLDKVSSGVEDVADKFKTMSIVGVAALATIATKVVDTGIQLLKSFTIDPIKDGFQNYQTQIQAVQTILANTSAAGTTLDQVTAALAQLNTYANLTVYNFSEMAQNIGTFTAAGVGLNTSVQAIKGIANLAAFSGSTSEQASSAMYQLSQAIASGTVKLQDWNSVVNAGLGGKTFQTALINTARNNGVAIDQIIKQTGSFRNSLQQGWLTSDVLTKTLEQFTGDLTLAQIKAMGYTDQQAQQIYNMGQTALNAATKIKTMSQLTQALKEEVATAYAAIFTTIFGNITQATVLFSSIHTVAENALTGPIYALNALLQGWEKLGGRTVLITAISDAFKELGTVIKAVEGAFREVFPPETAGELYNLTTGLLDVVQIFKIGATTGTELKQTFAGIFALVSIGIFIVKQIAMQFLNLLGYATQGSGGVLKLTANLGDFLVKAQKVIETGQGVKEFFVDFGDVLAVPIQLIRLLAAYVESLFNKFDGDKATKALNSVTVAMGPIGQLGRLADAAWTSLISHFGKLITMLAPLEKATTSFLSNLGKQVSAGFSDLNFNDLLGAVNTGLFAGLLLLIKKFIAYLNKDDEGPVSEIVKTIQESFEGLTKTLETMQGTLKAATLLEIAIAVGILTISMGALSKIDQAGLIRSSVAITVMFTQLVASMAIFQKFIGSEDFAKMPFMMLSLILLAAAIDLLVIAVKQLATMDWNSLSKGLTGLGVMLAELVASVKLMGNPEGLITTALGLAAFAKAVKTLTGAVITLSGLSWDQLGKGLAGVAGLLVSLALFSKFAEADKVGLSQGVGIVLLATGIKILASAMQTFGTMSWDTIGKGLTAMAGGLVLIVGALNLIPPDTVLSAASVVIVAASLQLIANAIQKMGSMSWSQIGRGVTVLAGGLGLIAAALTLLPPETVLSAASIFIVAASLNLIATALAKMGAMSWGAIAKSMVELAGSLAIIGAAVIFMIGALPGAAALLVVSAALLVLLPVLEAMGSMSWETMGKSLLELAGIFVILGGSAVILAPVVPVLLALGGAIALLGLGVLAAGVGVLAFSVALSALSLAGAAGTAALVGMVVALAGLIPLVMTQLGLGIIAFAKTIATAGPAFLLAITTVLDALITAIQNVTPKVVTMLLSLLLQLLQQMENYVPKMVTAGLNLVIGILNGIASKLGGVISAAANVVVAFLNGIANQFPKMIQAGINLIITFINSLATGIKNNSTALGQAGGNLATALIQGMAQGLIGGLGTLITAAKNLGSSVISSLKHVFDSHSPSRETMKIGGDVAQGLVVGLDNMSDAVSASATGIGKAAITSLSKTISGLSDQLTTSDPNFSPTVTPVLDLTGVKKTAGQIGGMLDGNTIKFGSTYSGAMNAADGYDSNTKPPSSGDGPVTPTVSNTFNQTINSPKAVAAIDVFRQTNNLISQQRGVLVYADGSSE